MRVHKTKYWRVEDYGRSGGFGDLERMSIKPSAEADQTMHVKKLPDAGERITEKTEGPVYWSHRGTGILLSLEGFLLPL